MKQKPQLIVMLTQDDKTVMNAPEVFEKCKDSKAQIWGFKEEPLPEDEMKKLFRYMKSLGKTTALEVVAYSEEEGLRGAKTAYDCGCDILMGTMFFDSINDYCKNHGLKYMPYVGEVTERPSILEGEAEDMVKQACEYLDKGVFGINLLGYRYTKDPVKLIETVVSKVPGPVCVAGSVDSFDRLDELKKANPWAFTIGSAFFERKYGQKIKEEINNVCAYIEK